MIACLTPHVTFVIGHFGYHNDEVRAIGHEFFTHFIGI